ncbi:MAG: diaminopimelate epimerase [Bacteroidetes bacterium]|nr:MAG: diaminopimelate epimerase [Bacteroidota bacterium]
MNIEFWKYQGNGNDFVVVDERNEDHYFSAEQIMNLCDRHFGIGADGMMIVKESDRADFEMQYYNADGKLSSMCGNGGRCIAMFAYLMKIAPKEMSFVAFDGVHKAIIEEELIEGNAYTVSLQMANVVGVEKSEKFYFLNTGSPHYVEFVKNLAEMDVHKEGRITRFSERFSPEGTNVNFVEIKGDRLLVRTYERGVEDETLSCGTGVTASAIAAFMETGKKDFQIQTTGGAFKVQFKQNTEGFSNICLVAPAKLVFSGVIEV